MSELPDSTFNKWRCLIALAFVDNKLEGAEREFLEQQIEVLRKQDISIDQLEILMSDLSNRQRTSQFLPQITDPLDKIDLIRLAYQLFQSDDDYDDEEQKAFEYLRTGVAESLGIDDDVLEQIVLKTQSIGSIRDLIARKSGSKN